MGTVEALKRRIQGGLTPGGMRKRMELTAAPTWDMAASMRTCGQKEMPDDAGAVDDLGIDGFHIVHYGHHDLTEGSDALLHLLCRQAGVGPDDGDDRDVDVGKDVGGGGGDGGEAEDQNEDRGYNECVRAIQELVRTIHI